MAQYRRDPTGAFPTAIDLQQKLKKDLSIDVNEASLRTRLRDQIEEPIYLDIFGREIPAAAQAFLDREMDKIREKWRRDPYGDFPTLTDVADRCKEGHHGIISVGTVCRRFQIGLGADLYDVLYGKGFDPAAEKFLAAKADRVMVLWRQNPNADIPTIRDITVECHENTLQKVSSYTVSIRFQILMGAEIYQSIYGKGLSPEVETFIAHEIDNIRARWHRDPFGKFPSPHALAIRCKAKIHEDVARYRRGIRAPLRKGSLTQLLTHSLIWERFLVS